MLIITLTLLLLFILFYLSPKYIDILYNKKSNINIIAWKISSMTINLIITLYALIKYQDTYNICAFIAMLLCFISDIAIFYNFSLGTLLFGTSHIFYLRMIMSLGTNKYIFIITTIISFMCLMLILFKFKDKMQKYFANQKLSEKLIRLIYIIILSLLLGLSISTKSSSNKIINITVIIASLLFVTSDVLLVENMINKPSPKKDRVSISAYYSAQFMFAVSALLNYIFSVSK